MSGRSPKASLDQTALAGDGNRLLCYLLFAGSQQTPQGGLGDLVGAFSSEAAAREAFRHLRLSQLSAGSWGQLAVVDGDHGIRALSWFGIGAAPARTPVTLRNREKSIHTRTEGRAMQIATRESPSPAGPEVKPIARRHPLKRTAVWLVGLVAVGIISVGVVSDDGSTRPASSPVLPAAVDDSVFTDATSGFQR